VGAGTITLRIDDLLVGIVGDSDDTIRRCRDTFAEWVDDTHPDVAPAFDLRAAGEDPGRRSLPQLRLGGSLVARSRSLDDVVDALDSILGGLRSQRAQPDRTWSALRVFASGDRAVLVDARAPALVNDPLLERSGIVELATWTAAVGDGNPSTIEVPGPLTRATGSMPAHLELVGLVLLDDTSPAPCDPLADAPVDTPADAPVDTPADASVDTPADASVDAPADASAPQPGGSLLARLASRHTSPVWFRTVDALLADGRVVTSSDRVAARTAIAGLLSTSP
jgi:hypothetical protein